MERIRLRDMFNFEDSHDTINVLSRIVEYIQNNNLMLELLDVDTISTNVDQRVKQVITEAFSLLADGYNPAIQDFYFDTKLCALIRDGCSDRVINEVLLVKATVKALLEKEGADVISSLYRELLSKRDLR